MVYEGLADRIMGLIRGNELAKEVGNNGRKDTGRSFMGRCRA